MGNAFVAQAHAELKRWQVELVPLILDAIGAQHRAAIETALPAQLDRLLTLMPDPGWRAAQMRAFSIGGAIYIAVYLALREHGLTAEQTWAICEEATRLHFTRMPALQRWLLGKTMFSSLWKLLSRWLAARSRQAPVGNWRLEYLPPQAGEYDYGIDYTRCAIFQLAQDAGAADFAPYICQSDAVGSSVLGWGLTRTQTLAQGGTHCNFRFRQGGQTDVRFRLPVVR